MKKLETSYLTQIWTNGSCPQKEYSVWAYKQEFATILKIQLLNIAKLIYMFIPTLKVVTNGKQPLKSARENKTVNSSITSVGTPNLKEARIHVS